LQPFPQGRLVPRQPWAIKSTTRTELPHENISIAKYIHWDAGMTPTALHYEGISIAKYIHWNAGMTLTALISLIMHNLR